MGVILQGKVKLNFIHIESQTSRRYFTFSRGTDQFVIGRAFRINHGSFAQLQNRTIGSALDPFGKNKSYISGNCILSIFLFLNLGKLFQRFLKVTFHRPCSSDWLHYSPWNELSVHFSIRTELSACLSVISELSAHFSIRKELVYISILEMNLGKLLIKLPLKDWIISKVMQLD